MSVYYLVSGPGSSSGTEADDFSVAIDGKQYPRFGFHFGKEFRKPYPDNPGSRSGIPGEQPEHRLQRSVINSLLPQRPVRLRYAHKYGIPQSKGIGYPVYQKLRNPRGAALGTEIPLGSVVRVRLRVSTKANLNYVAIDDLLPAGFEALNTVLLTTEAISDEGESAAAKQSKPYISYQEFRDHRVAFYANELPARDHEFVYYVRATTPGRSSCRSAWRKPCTIRIPTVPPAEARLRSSDVPQKPGPQGCADRGSPGGFSRLHF
uniref:Bacterial alpha-2-macroglobulin MG10 domain-containing protein n=1 Tax=Breznakiella homolactica TaxID=2798577 RepID=A0A7T7XN07_9SPIR